MSGERLVQIRRGLSQQSDERIAQTPVTPIALAYQCGTNSPELKYQTFSRLMVFAVKERPVQLSEGASNCKPYDERSGYLPSG
jgi:hypothetical protein